MVKYFCDYCENEIDDDNRIDGDRLKTQITADSYTLSIEIITGLNGVANAGHFCKYCVIQAVNKLDDRPKPDREYARGA